MAPYGTPRHGKAVKAGRAGQGRAGLDITGHGISWHHATSQDKARQSRKEGQGRARQNRAWHWLAPCGKPRQGKTVNAGRAGQGRAGQGMALVGTMRHAKTRQGSQGMTGKSGQGRARKGWTGKCEARQGRVVQYRGWQDMYDRSVKRQGRWLGPAR